MHGPSQRVADRWSASILLLLIAGAGCAGERSGRVAATPPPLPPPVPVKAVEVVKRDGKFVLLRQGAPYYVNGVGGHTRIDVARGLGANSIRTWGADRAAEAFAQAEAHGMTVLLGLWLSHNRNDYVDEGYKARLRTEMKALVERYRRHPALLMWALGNEIQLGADTPEAWQFVEELARIVRGADTDHPIATVTAHAPAKTLELIVRHAPSIEVLGVNSYAGLASVPSALQRSAFKGPYMITEWGPNGHWEVAKTAWGRPIEQTGAEKFKVYQERAALIRSFEGCLGSYVFLWGQKQERTPTWYSMFVETSPERGLAGEATATVDAMAHAWSGAWPTNRAPLVGALELGGAGPEASREVKAGQAIAAVTRAEDPDGDSIQFRWELLREPTELGEGGSRERRPEAVSDAIRPEGAQAHVTPPSPGEYRLFVYAFDGKGKVGTANYPFRAR